jgi:hypothetical protein
MALCYSPIDVCGLQANRLDCDGNILEGETDVVVSCAVVDVTVTPVQGDDEEQRDPNGQGGFCAKRESRGTIEGMEVELTLCSKTDIELMELLGIWDLVYDAAGECIGIKAKCCSSEVCACDPGDEPCSNPGVAFHLWHLAWCGDAAHPDYKWAVQHFPKLVFDPASVVVQRNSEFNTYTVTANAKCNDNYATGPGAIYPDPAGIDTCWAETLTNEGPESLCNCDRCGYSTEGVLAGVAVIEGP